MLLGSGRVTLGQGIADIVVCVIQNAATDVGRFLRGGRHEELLAARMLLLKLFLLSTCGVAVKKYLLTGSPSVLLQHLHLVLIIRDINPHFLAV